MNRGLPQPVLSASPSQTLLRARIQNLLSKGRNSVKCWFGRDSRIRSISSFIGELMFYAACAIGLAIGVATFCLAALPLFTCFSVIPYLIRKCAEKLRRPLSAEERARIDEERAREHEERARNEIATKLAISIKKLDPKRPRALSLEMGCGNDLEQEMETCTEQSIDGAKTPESGLESAKREDEATLDTPAAKTVQQQTIDQFGTCLLWKLPFEIRAMVWRHTLGYSHVHIVKRKGRLGNIYCPADDPKSPIVRDLCLSTRDKDGYYKPTVFPVDVKPLALLFTCRQIYSEAINLLYSSNTFAFDESKTLRTFFTTILPQRARRITSIHIAPNVRDDSVARFRDRYNVRPTWEYEPDNFALLPWSECLEFLENGVPGLTLSKLSVTPKIDKFRTEATVRNDEQFDLMINFLQRLNNFRANQNVKITLSWPKDTRHLLYRDRPRYFWASKTHIPSPLRLTIREFVCRPRSQALAFVIPFHTQCLHCSDYTILRKATVGGAEIHIISDSDETYLPIVPNIAHILRCRRLAAGWPTTLTRYHTKHSTCDGWIVYDCDEETHEWSVGFGGREVGEEEAMEHLKEVEEGHYPKIPTLHEINQGLDVEGERFLERMLDMRVIDYQTRHRLYKNLGRPTNVFYPNSN